MSAYTVYAQSFRDMRKDPHSGVNLGFASPFPNANHHACSRWEMRNDGAEERSHLRGRELSAVDFDDAEADKNKKRIFLCRKI